MGRAVGGNTFVLPLAVLNTVCCLAGNSWCKGTACLHKQGVHRSPANWRPTKSGPGNFWLALNPNPKPWSLT